jgi:acetyl-CoA acetyltransferase
MTETVVVAGVGMVPFRKPGDSKPYHEMGAEAAGLALADAGLGYAAVEQAYVGYVCGDSTSGQRAPYDVGMTGVPLVNVNNNCSSGSTALFLARQAVQSGMADCALALGLEQMQPGHPLGATGLARCYELTHQLRGTGEARQVEGARLAIQHNLGLGGAAVVTLYEKH